MQLKQHFKHKIYTKAVSDLWFRLFKSVTQACLVYSVYFLNIVKIMIFTLDEFKHALQNAFHFIKYCIKYTSCSKTFMFFKNKINKFGQFLGHSEDKQIQYTLTRNKKINVTTYISILAQQVKQGLSNRRVFVCDIQHDLHCTARSSNVSLQMSVCTFFIYFHSNISIFGLLDENHMT